MTSTELELVGAIYALYANECIYWLGENETAYTRRTAAGWRTWPARLNGFTLLGRRPCAVNLLPFRAGLARVDETERDAAQTLRRTELEMSRARWLLIAMSLEAAVLLALIPAVIAAGALHALWPKLAAVLLLLHAATVILFHRALRRWETNPRARAKYVFAACVNPLAVVRCGDVLAGRIFASVRLSMPMQR